MPDEREAKVADARKAFADQYELDDYEFNADVDAQPVRVKITAGETKSAPQAKSEPQKHSPRLVRMATKLGFPQHTIDNTSSDNLEEAIAAALEREPTRRETPAPKATKEEIEPPKRVSKFTVENGYDKDAVEEINYLRDSIEELRSLKQEMAAIREAEQGRRADELFTEVDHGFAELGSEFEGVFGKGRGKTMDAKNDAFKRRVSVVNSLRSDPIEGLSVRDAIIQRSRELYGFAAKAKAPELDDDEEFPPERPVKKKRIDEETWSRAGLASPTQRKAPEAPKGRKRAVESVQRILRVERNGESSEEDDLPD